MHLQNLQTIQVLLAGEQHSELVLSWARQLHLAAIQQLMTNNAHLFHCLVHLLSNQTVNVKLVHTCMLHSSFS